MELDLPQCRHAVGGEESLRLQWMCIRAIIPDLTRDLVPGFTERLHENLLRRLNWASIVLLSCLLVEK